MKKTMQSKYPGTCRNCKAPIKRGDLITYHGRGSGVSCAKCSPTTDNSSYEDRACGDTAYEDACAAACGM